MNESFVVAILPQRKPFITLGLAEACYQITPHVALGQNEILFLNIRPHDAFYKKSSWSARLHVLLQKFNQQDARVAIGSSAEWALAQGRWGLDVNFTPNFNLNGAVLGASTGDGLPLEALHDFYHPFQSDELVDPLIVRMIGLLKKLGIRSIAEFQDVPERELTIRFGHLGTFLSQKVHGHQNTQWPQWKPPEDIEEHLEIESAQGLNVSSTLEGLLFYLKTLMDRICSRLRVRAERVTAMTLSLRLDAIQSHTSLRTYTFSFALPHGTTASLLPLVREKLSHVFTQDPLLDPIVEVSLKVTGTARALNAQRDFFSRYEEDTESWNGLISRLIEKLGADHVFIAAPEERHLPEGAWSKRVAPSIDETKIPASFSTGLTFSRSKRPTRLLKIPHPLKRMGRTLCDVHSREQWKILEWEGPERIACEWWSGVRSRDYFRILTEDGRSLWVFEANGESYLQGYFD